MTNLLLLLVILLILGFFAGIEVAFVSANKLSVELKKKQGKRSGVILSELLENPYEFIGSCIVGYSFFLVIYGLLVSRLLEPFWKYSGIQQLDGSGPLKVIAEILLATALVLLVEFVARAIFRAKTDGSLSLFAGTMQLIHRLLQPIGQLLVGIAVWILKYIFNVQVESRRRPFSRVDLEHYYQQTKEAEDENQELNQELFENALGLPGVKVRSCLVPRKEVVAVPLQSSVDAVRQKMVDTKLSRLIVYDGNIDNIVGYVHQLDMFRQPAELKDILLPIPAVPETMSVSDLISRFSAERKSIAWVVDEFGGTAGIVTMEDLLEEIFGEIQDEYDTEELVERQISPNEYVFSGRLELDLLKEKYNLDFPARSETLSGFIIHHHNQMPKQGDLIIIDDYQFEILSMGDTRVELVQLKILR